MERKKPSLFDNEIPKSTTSAASLLRHGSRVNEPKEKRTVYPGYIVDGKFKSGGSGEIEKFDKFSPNSVQISNEISYLMQKQLQGIIDEVELRKTAYDKLKDTFAKHDLLSPIGTKEEVKEKKRKIELMIAADVREQAKKILSPYSVIKSDFKEFVAGLGIKQVMEGERVKIRRLYGVLKEAKGSACVSYRVDTISEVDGKLVSEHHFRDHSLIPAINIVVDGEAAQGKEMGNFENFEELVKSRIRYKEKYIKRIEFEFSVDALVAFALPKLSKTYAVSNRHSIKPGFSKYAFQIDLLARKVENAQHFKNLNKYNVDELMSKMGVNYSRYGSFKHKVLMPAIQEINKAGAIFIELVEIEKIGKKVVSIAFRVIRENLVAEEDDFSHKLTLSYFIAVQHYYKNVYVSKDLPAFISFSDYLSDIKVFTTNYFNNQARRFSNEEGDEDFTLEEWNGLYLSEKEEWEILLGKLSIDQPWLRTNGAAISYKKLSLVNDDDERDFFTPYKKRKDFKLMLPGEALDYYDNTKEKTDD